MARIQFKAKIQQVYNMDDSLAYSYIQVPQLERRHCDMAAFRCHAKYGDLANSDFFPGVLRNIRTQIFGAQGRLRLDRIPENVSVDSSSFLAVVTLDV